MVSNFIARQGDIQILITKGERLVQECKIVTLNLDQWFGDRIEIVEEGSKTKEIFLKYAVKFPDCIKISVGNSYNSDIRPALEAGIRGIFIPYYTWLGEKPPADIDETTVFKIEKIKQILDLYRRKSI